jgi:hypothetical protein
LNDYATDQGCAHCGLIDLVTAFDTRDNRGTAIVSYWLFLFQRRDYWVNIYYVVHSKLTDSMLDLI